MKILPMLQALMNPLFGLLLTSPNLLLLMTLLVFEVPLLHQCPLRATLVGLTLVGLLCGLALLPRLPFCLPNVLLMEFGLCHALGVGKVRRPLSLEQLAARAFQEPLIARCHWRPTCSM